MLVARKLAKKLVYSPEYVIRINEVSPLYHSDEHELELNTNEFGVEEAAEIKSYINMEVLRQMYKDQQ